MRSSRRGALKGLVGLGGLALFGACKHAAPPPLRAPLLAHREAGSTTAEPPDAMADALWLSLSSPAVADRERAIDLLSGLLDSVLARAVGLDDWVSSDLNASFERERAWLLPTLTAAECLVSEQWTTPEIEVRALRDASAAAKNERIVEAWSWSGSPVPDELGRRARFAAWALSNAVCVRGLGPAERERLTQELRLSIARDASNVGVVLDAELQARRGAPAALTSLAERCRRSRRLLATRKQRISEVGLLVALTEITNEPLVKSVPLGAGDVLVVPRLSALGSRSGLVDHLRDLLSEVGAPRATLDNA